MREASSKGLMLDKLLSGQRCLRRRRGVFEGGLMVFYLS
jgi:hypothetical protein